MRGGGGVRPAVSSCEVRGSLGPNNNPIYVPNSEQELGQVPLPLLQQVPVAPTLYSEACVKIFMWIISKTARPIFMKFGTDVPQGTL